MVHVLSWCEVDSAGVVLAGLIAGYVMALARLWAGAGLGLAAVPVSGSSAR